MNTKKMIQSETVISFHNVTKYHLWLLLISFLISSSLWAAPAITMAGIDLTGSDYSLLLVASTDGGITWAKKSVTGGPANGFLISTSCLGSGTTTCYAAGQDRTGNFPPLLTVSTDGGSTWSVQTITGSPTHGHFLGVSCTDTSCVAVGRDLSTSAPLIAATTDSGVTWKVKTITGNPTSGTFYQAHCTGTGATALCIATGQDFTGTGPPLLAASTDGGSSWAVQTITGNSTNGCLFGASCKGSGGTASCFAAGEDFTGTDSPFLVFSKDGGGLGM